MISWDTPSALATKIPLPLLGRARLKVRMALWSHVCVIIVVQDPLSYLHTQMSNAAFQRLGLTV